MHKRPLGVISVFFIIGIVLAKYLPDSLGVTHVFIATLIFIVISFGLSRCSVSQAKACGYRFFSAFSNIFLLLSVTSFAIPLYINSNTFPNNHISYFLGEDKIKADMVGIIKSPALTRKPYYGKISSTYLFEVEAVRVQGSRLKVQGEWQKMSGLALIRIQTEKDYQYGDRLLAKGTIKRPSSVAAASYAGNMDKGHHKMVQLQEHKKNSFDYREYLENQNIFAIINASEKNVTLLSHNYKSNPVPRFAYFVREKLKNQFLEKMPLESGAFLRAILLGDRSELPKKLNESFRNSGTMHILPIQNTKKLNYPS